MVKLDRSLVTAILIVVIIIILVCWIVSRRSNGKGCNSGCNVMVESGKPLAKELKAYVGTGSGHFHRPLVANRSHSDRRRHHHHSPDDCENCKEGGLDAKCRSNDDCACGLQCQGRKCVCPKPPPPNLHIQAYANDITVTWSPVPGADYYDLYLMDGFQTVHAIQLFYVGTVFTFTNLPAGVYYVFAFSGSDQCGMLQQFSQSDAIQIGQCGSNLDCPPDKPYCNDGICVECNYDEQCPSQMICQSNQCVDDFPPPECATDQDCLPGEICSGGECICLMPVVTGITVEGTWRSGLQFTVHANNTGATVPGQWPKYTIRWTMTGYDGQTALSGFLLDSYLVNGKWPDTPWPGFYNANCSDQPCCSLFKFGCPENGCGVQSNVVITFTSIIVTNSCGESSVPTCWEFSSLCSGGPSSGTQIACPTQPQ